ncbi:MAG: PaaI family thioesterase [Planctomycetota bacterium]
MDENRSLQDQFAPDLICFGCGPANEKGLQIKSFVAGEKVIATFSPQSHHQAFEGMVNGGIIGSLLDCHMNWTAAWQLMRNHESEMPPCTVTGEFTVSFKAPTPSDAELKLEAWVEQSDMKKASIKSTLTFNDQVSATGRGVFIAVREGHPAFHRW